MTTPLHTRVGQLVRLLSSDQAGEAGAAALALNRAINAAGHDIHWLANLVEGALQVPLVPAEPEEVWWEEALEVCREHIDELPPRDRDFVRSFAKWHGVPSAKQLQWLHDIHERICRGCR